VRQLAAQADVVLVVGSQNSSNSQRLAELARAGGVPAYLIDGPADIVPGWFRGDETVLITAGASAPEDLVQQCVKLLQDRYHARLEHAKVRDEDVHFVLPRELR
jgi:4-hydroxy-3-methylbut-2-enyl diphosphate reductase